MITSNKNIYRTLLVVSFVGMIVLILYGIGNVLSYFNTGADRSSMLQVPLKKQMSYVPKLEWKDTDNPGRPIVPQTLAEIKRDYINAWYVKTIAYRTNEGAIIDDYYTENARQPILKTIAYNGSESITIESTTTDHQLSLDFYSADGQLAVVTDHNVEEYQRIYKEEKIVGQTTTQSDYQALLLLEDGFWRIRHFVKTKSQPLKDIAQESIGLYSTKDQKIFANGKEYTIKGINYYPQLTPWDMFGNNFDCNVIEADFEIIKNEGLNTVRVFIQYEDFGKANVIASKLEKLAEVLNIAERKGLKLIVTLFDFYGNYDVSDWTFTHRHAEQIVSRFKDHKAILAWDIKNEPDLDFENRGRENVLAWITSMTRQIKKYDPNHLVTVGWANIQSATLLSNQLDIQSFHYYQDIEDFEVSFELLRSKTNKPLLLQEFGLSSYRGLWNPFGATEKQQATYYQKFQELVDKNSLNYMSWTLYDFDEVPVSVAGRLPWRTHKQKYFGFIDRDGNKKEAYKFISN